MAFPSSPSNGQTAVVNGILYAYSSTNNSWTRQVNTLTSLSTGNLITTNGVFWSNGNAYSSGSSSASLTGISTFVSNSTVVITANTASTSNSSGALQVNGGVGIQGNLWVGGGNGGANDPLASDAHITGRLTVGQIGLGYPYVTINVDNNGNWSPGYVTGWYGRFYSGLWGPSFTATTSGVSIASTTSITNSTAATSTSTGAFVVTGGVGIGGNVYAGSGIQNTPIGSFTPNIGIFTALSATNSTTSTSTSTGALTVNGGAGIGGNAYVGGNVYAGALYDSIGNVRDFALNTQSASYTLVATDDSKLINTTANVIIPTGVFTAGQTVTLYNNSGSNIYVTSSGTVYSAGTNLTGTRILAQRGLGTIVCVATNTFVISGAGLY
jgi:hypothetical protein